MKLLCNMFFDEILYVTEFHPLSRPFSKKLTLLCKFQHNDCKENSTSCNFFSPRGPNPFLGKGGKERGGNGVKGPTDGAIKCTAGVEALYGEHKVISDHIKRPF